MKILVTGVKEQLDRESVLALIIAGEDVVAIDREELDYSNHTQVAEGITSHGIDLVSTALLILKSTRSRKSSTWEF